MPGLVAMALASAIASGLADEDSDRAGAKVTLTTELGNSAARNVVESAIMAGALLWFWFARGYLAEGRRWLEEALARSRERFRLRQSAQADEEGA